MKPTPEEPRIYAGDLQLSRLTQNHFEYNWRNSSWVWTSKTTCSVIQPKLLAFGTPYDIPPPYLGFNGYVWRMPISHSDPVLHTVEAPSMKGVIELLENYLQEHLPEELPPIPRSAWVRIVGDVLGEDWRELIR